MHSPTPADLNNYTVAALKEMLRERDLQVSGRKAELIDRLSAALAAEERAAQSAPPGPSPERDAFYDTLDGLNDVVEELEDATDGFDAPPFSRQALLALLRDNIEKFTPEMRMGILRELRQITSGMSPQDVLDPDTWRGMWFLLNYTAQSKAEELQQGLSGITSMVQAIPGGETLVGLGQMAQNVQPRDLLEIDTYKGIWFLATYTAQAQTQSLRDKVLGNGDDRP